jgi:hypothetical protein
VSVRFQHNAIGPSLDEASRIAILIVGT